MAYPTVSAPYGLDPVNRIDFMPYAGATRLMAIGSNVSTAIYHGDVVLLNAGYIQKSTVTTDSTTALANATYGVFMGCQYVNTQGQLVQAQYFPGNASASSATAYIVDDSMAAFKVAITFSGNTTVTTANATVVGTNLALRQGTGSTTTGDSAVSVVAPTTGAGNAAALPVRVVAVVPETATSPTAFTEVIVKLNNPQIIRTTGNDYV
jgi:hypothetical protein